MSASRKPTDPSRRTSHATQTGQQTRQGQPIHQAPHQYTETGSSLPYLDETDNRQTNQWTTAHPPDAYGQTGHHTGGHSSYQTGTQPNYQTGTQPRYQTGTQPRYQTGGQPRYQTGGQPHYQTGGHSSYQTGGQPRYQTGMHPHVNRTGPSHTQGHPHVSHGGPMSQAHLHAPQQSSPSYGYMPQHQAGPAGPMNPYTSGEYSNPLGTQELMAAFHGSEHDPAELARHAMQSFAQALKKYALYGHKKTGKEGYFARAMHVLETFLQHFGSMTLTLQPFDMHLEGESVFHDNNQDNSLTYKLYRSGIRSITFEAGLDFEELVSFAKILMKTPVELLEEDIASLMWKEDFQTITYLQVQSVEMIDEASQDGYELTQLISYIQSQMLAHNPLEGVNFRGFAGLDLFAEQALANAETQRFLGISPSYRQAGEDDVLLQQWFTAEQEQSTNQGTWLYIFLMRHVDSMEAMIEFEAHIHALSHDLLEQRDFTSLAQLLDGLHWQLEAHHLPLQAARKELLKRLLDRLNSEENVAFLQDAIQQIATLRQEQRHDLRIYINLLGTKIYKPLRAMLPDVDTTGRRFLLETICTSPYAPQLTQRILTQSTNHEQLLYETLNVAASAKTAVPYDTLDNLLSHKSQRIQSKAFQLLLLLYPEEAPFLAEAMLKDAANDFRLFLLSSLCEAEELGISLALAYVQSEEASKLPHAEQEAIYKVLGRSQDNNIIGYFGTLLMQQSRMLKPHIDKQKKLALLGLVEANHTPARQQLINALQQRELHSKKGLDELEEALALMQRRI